MEKNARAHAFLHYVRSSWTRTQTATKQSCCHHNIMKWRNSLLLQFIIAIIHKRCLSVRVHARARERAALTCLCACQSVSLTSVPHSIQHTDVDLFYPTHARENGARAGAAWGGLIASRPNCLKTTTTNKQEHQQRQQEAAWSRAPSSHLISSITGRRARAPLRTRAPKKSRRARTHAHSSVNTRRVETNE